jgi:hypothetical protein
MANVAIFRSGQTPVYLTSVHTPDYEGDPDVIINPDISAVAAVPLKYWKRVVNAIQEMTAGEKTTVDNAEAATILVAKRTIAAALSDSIQADGIQWRALALLLLDEFNTLRQWTVSFKAEVAASTNLSNLQTRVATLPTLSDRTITQVKQAYNTKINGGSAD